MTSIWDSDTLWQSESDPSNLWDDNKAWGGVPVQQYVTDSAIRGVASLPGLVGDVVKDIGEGAWNLAKGGLHGDVSTMIPQHFPGFDVASQKVQQAVNQQLGPPPQPVNTAEKYLGALASGAAAGAVSLNPEGVLAGAMSGAGGQAGSDLVPGSEWAPFIGSLVAPGLSHTGLHALIRHLEGGGTIEHPLVSPKGAVGPMQVMPGTAADPGLGVKPWDGTPKDRVRLGNDYADALDKHYDGDETKVLAAYNAGFGHVDHLIEKFGDNWKEHLPLETINYLAHAGLLHNDNPGSTGKAVPPLDPELIAKVMGDDQKSSNVLTLAEQQDMDASVPKIVPPTAIDARAIGHGADLPEQTPANDTNVVSLDQARDEKNLKDFHADLLSQIDDKVEIYKRLAQEAHDSGLLPLEVGDRFTTPKSREQGAGPWKVIGHYVDPKDPERYGYYVERGTKGSDDYESSQMLVSDPKADAKLAEKGYGFDRPANVASWQKLGGLSKVDNTGGEPPQEPPSGGGNAGDNGEEPPSGPEMSPEDKLIKAINEARPASQETKDMVSQVKANQAKKLAEIQARGGSLPEQLSSLKGELPKADYESVADQFTPDDVKALDDKIRGNNSLYPFEKLDVHKALHKLLNPEGLSIPTDHELDLLADVFSPNLIKALVDRQRGVQSLNQKIANIGGIPRTLMSSADLSAPARQGLLFIGRKEFWKNYPQMVKMFGSKVFYDKAMKEIKERPTYGLMRRSGLAVRDSVLLKDREEYFVSNMAENMPGENIKGIGLLSKGYNRTVGAMVRASDRAYTGFLRKLRADVFDTITAKGSEAGIDWESSPEKLKALGNFINTATGRGDLGKFEQASQAFSTIFFAPRLIKARMDTLNPVYYAKLYHADPLIAKEAFKSVASFSAIAATALSLAVAGGATVEGDIRSADGLKIKIGDTRIDLLGGYQQYLRLIAQMTSDSTKTQKGNIKSLSSGQYGAQTRWDTLMNFGANKLAPIPGIARDYLKGKDPGGNKFSAKQDAIQAVTPMDITDIADSMKQNGPKGAWVALPAILGVGVQTYTPMQASHKGIKDPFKEPSVWGEKDVWNDPSVWGKQ